MTTTRQEKIAAALALIGKKRPVCPICQRPLVAASYVDATHTPRSAAIACGLDPQLVYRAWRKMKAQA